MDISETLAPKSEQLDAVELAGGPRTVTITEATPGSAEQPVNVHLTEYPRPWRPAKTVRRILAAAWGTDTRAWVGKRATIYLDPAVKYAGQPVGGIRVSALSGIEKPLTVPVIETRGKIRQVTVQPLPDDPPASRAPSCVDRIAASTDIGQLRAMWGDATPDERQLITRRVHELQDPAPEPEPVELPFDDGGDAA